MVTAKAKTKSKVGSKVAKIVTRKAPKGKAVSSKAVSKPAPKSVKKAPPKPAPKAKAKTEKKPAPKPVPKPAPKTAPKSAKKPAAKRATKPAAKPTPKPVPKPAPKPVSKPAAKLASRTGVHVVPAKTAKAVSAKSPPAAPAIVNSLAKPSTVKIGGGLSEAEVIKQSRIDYMTRQQLSFFKQRLLELQTELRDNAGATTEHLREISVAPDPADRATLEEEHALELRTRDRERKLLKKVQSALMRIEDGSYGYCEETGEPIGIQRLLARPTATLTIEAQERRELKQKMYGD